MYVSKEFYESVNVFNTRRRRFNFTEIASGLVLNFDQHTAVLIPILTDFNSLILIY